MRKESVKCISDGVATIAYHGIYLCFDRQTAFGNRAGNWTPIARGPTGALPVAASRVAAPRLAVLARRSYHRICLPRFSIFERAHLDQRLLRASASAFFLAASRFARNACWFAFFAARAPGALNPSFTKSTFFSGRNAFFPEPHGGHL